ncbi:hypothetical protein AAVH_03190 [Aphelenchoides avenae]|nr:hypothetical protein AAVH_03190 [Aphelenchus avenae]
MTTSGVTASNASQATTSSEDETTGTSLSASDDDAHSVTDPPSTLAQAKPARIYVTCEFDDLKAELLDQIDCTKDALNHVFATLSRSAATRKAIREYIAALDGLVNLYV